MITFLRKTGNYIISSASFIWANKESFIVIFFIIASMVYKNKHHKATRIDFVPKKQNVLFVSIDQEQPCIKINNYKKTMNVTLDCVLLPKNRKSCEGQMFIRMQERIFSLLSNAKNISISTIDKEGYTDVFFDGVSLCKTLIENQLTYSLNYKRGKVDEQDWCLLLEELKNTLN